ncbi:hypothetical protein JD844_006075 [Phrynosoma platyrhinos]|uniref:Exocyst complex component 3-like protein 2 n=1 Tax=Phrynosoma platyrhinos TaxID=52577 RepID=A0ABQ7TQ95_PHRPL|nr:hypothetical protein JD844_006075 [Phrynosoma platyrhinos]
MESLQSRRCSEDFSLLQRFNGRRKESLYSSDCGLAEKENGGADTMKRFLKIGLGAKVRRASLVEKLNQTEVASEPAPVMEEVEVKPKEPLSVLEILSLIQQRDLLVADEHIIELEAECQEDGQPQSLENSSSLGSSNECRKDGSRKAKDVALLYEALQKELWSVLAESLAAKSTYLPLELMVRVIDQEEDTDRKWMETQRDAVAKSGPRPRSMKKRWAEAVSELVKQRLSRCVEGRAGPLATQMDRLAKCALEDLCTVKFHLLHAYPKEYEAFGVYLCSYHRGLAQHLAEVVQKNLTISELYFILDWNSNIYQREVLGRAEISSLVKGHDLGPLLSPETQFSLEEDCIAAVKPYFHKLMKRKWLNNSEAFPTIMALLREHAQKLSKMKLEPYQESNSSWLDSVVPHLAGIIELEDTPAIQMEVGFLAREFPDLQ